MGNSTMKFQTIHDIHDVSFSGLTPNFRCFATGFCHWFYSITGGKTPEIWDYSAKRLSHGYHE